VSAFELMEIVLGLADGTAHRVVPRPSAVTVVPVDLENLSGEDVGRAVRDVLVQPRRSEAASKKVPFVRVTLENREVALVAADDAFQNMRLLTVEQKGKVPLLFEANTQSVVDDARLEVVLGRIATTLGTRSPDELGPALSAATGPGPSPSEASPKEQAYARAQAKAAARAAEIHALDDRMTRSVVPDWLWVASGVGGLGVLMTAVTLYYPRAKPIVLPLMVLLLCAGLAAYAWRALRELKTRSLLQETRLKLREERETARREAAELGETLRRKGLDPEEVLRRVRPDQPSASVPAILFRKETSTLEVTALADLKRQVVLFVDRLGVLAGEDYGDALRRIEPAEAPARAP
jgi:hypothetical protein